MDQNQSITMLPQENPLKRGWNIYRKLPISAQVSLLSLSLFLMVTPVFVKSNFDIRQHAASGPTVTVSNVTMGKIQTQLSTNDVWAGIVRDIPQGQAKLNTLHAPLVRLHIGDDGGPDAEPQPELTQNQWNFTNMNVLVDEIFASGQEPLLNMKFAPDWQWSCYPNTQTGRAGTVRDTSFQEYAQYMARIVRYYNKGTMTSATGQVITNPAGTTHKITWWEPWNEPDLNNETPCAPATGNGLTPQQYVTMWNAVIPAMLAVDPTLKFVGPATAGSQFGSSTGGTNNQYVDLLMANATHKPDAISFHGYGYWDNTVSDKWIFDGDNTEPTAHCCGGITDLVYGVKAIHTKFPSVPVWLTEVNVNADWGDDTHARPWSELGAAWWASAFSQLAPLNVGIIHQYLIAESPQFGMIDTNTGNPFMVYYVTQLLNGGFPQGSTILSTSSTQHDVQSLAVQKPDGTISVLLVNRQIGTSTSNCGTGGLPITVNVALQGVTATSVSVQQLDKTNVNCSTKVATAPKTVALDPNNMTVTFPGYGMAIVTIATNGQPLPTTAPAPTSVPQVTPTTVPTPIGTTATPTPQVSVSYTISGIMFNDLNQDGKKEIGETAYVSPVTVSLSGLKSVITTTDVKGRYTFSGLDAGSYKVAVAAPVGYKITSPNPQSISITTANIGLAQLSSATPTLPSTGSLDIFTDGLVTGWSDNSWGDTVNNFAVTSPLYTGTKAMSFNVTLGYGGISLKHAALSTVGYTALHFAAQATNTTQRYSISLVDNYHNQIQELLLSDFGALSVGSWKTYDIPLSKLNPRNKLVTEVVIQDVLNKTEPLLYLDDIKFIK
jgi:hypothetical protein